MTGSARYNDGVVLMPGRLGGGGRGDGGPVEAACTNCHGDTATSGTFRTVSHTPQQTGGFSDDELIKIFTQGVLPPNAYFDETIVSKQQWSNFHKWGMTPEQAKALVVYLRALTPQSQMGSRADFGGRRMRPDGGGGDRGDGGRRLRPDGGPDGGGGPGGGGGPDGNIGPVGGDQDAATD